MLGKIVGWLVGGGVSAIGDQLNRAYDRKLTADTDEKKLEAEKEIAYLKGKRDILLKEQDNPVTRWVRPAIAGLFIIYIFKIVVWDKVLGLGATDPLSPEMYAILEAVISFYFLGRSAEKITKTLIRR